MIAVCIGLAIMWRKKQTWTSVASGSMGVKRQDGGHMATWPHVLLPPLS